MPTTEIALLSLKPESNVGDSANPAAGVLKQTCATLTGPAESQQVHFGTAIEDGSKLTMFIDWDDLPKHQAFIASSIYGDFRGTIKTIVQAPPNIKHVDFQPQGASNAALAAPVTEVLTLYFDGEVPAEYGEGIQKLTTMTKDVESAKAIAWGSTHETLEHDGVKGKAVVLLIGWTSKEDHMAFRDTDLFKECTPLIRSSSKAAEVFHIQAMKYHD